MKRYWIACSAALMLCGCSPKPEEPLKVASAPWPGYEPFYLARDLEYFTSDEVNYFELPSSDITLESFRNHSADLATLTLDEILDLLRSGTQLRILLVLDSSNGADAVMARPTLPSLADLKSKRVAVENIPLGVYMLSRMLDKAQISREDIQIIPLAENRHEDYYQQDKADAFITMEPVKSQLASLGAHTIFDSSQIPNEIIDILVVHEEVFQHRRDAVCRFARHWFDVQAYMKAHPDDASSHMAKRLGKTPEEFKTMLEGLRFPTLADNIDMLGGAAPKIIELVHKLNEVMLREKQLEHPVDITPSLVPDIVSCIQ